MSSMVVARQGKVEASDRAVSVARVAVSRGVTSSELRGDASLRAAVLAEAGEAGLDDVEWVQVAGVLADATRRAASAYPRESGECRSCGQPVRWVETVKGSRMMLDPLPCPSRGNVEVKPSGSRMLAFVNSPRSVPLVSVRPVFRPHAATCPRPERRLRSVSKSAPGPLCAVCRLPMDRHMYSLGERTHPTCSEVAGG